MAIITHLNMMQLSYPASSIAFFSVVFSYVTYDVIPTENMYLKLFGFVEDPYSDQANNVGYPAIYLIPNSGSMPIFILIHIVT